MNECWIILPHVKTYWHIKSDEKEIIEFFKMQYGNCVLQENLDTFQYKDLIVLRESNEFYRVKKEDGFDELIAAKAFPGFWNGLFLQNVSEEGYCYIHGSAAEINGKVFLFIGKSYSGKSTLIAYLVAKGAEYISDDRLVLYTSEGKITPLTRGINLREETKELLEYKYNISFQAEEYEFQEYKRWRYMPLKLATEDKRVSCAFLLERKEEGNVLCEECNQIEALNIYMENSLSIPDLKNIVTYAQLAKTVKLYKLQYSSMEDVRKFLMETELVV